MEKRSPLQAKTPSKKKHSFRKIDRLLISADFDEVFKNAEERLAGKHSMILALFNNKPGPRLGLVVAKKKIAQSKQRNNFKRATKEAFRKNKFKLKSLDIVVLAKKNKEKVLISEVNNELINLFKQLEK